MSTTDIDRELLVDSIREWLRVENEIKMLNAELKKRRARKRELSQYLSSVMKVSDTDQYKTKQGNINLSVEKRPQYIGKNFLMRAIGGFFHDDPYLAKDLIEHVLESREVKKVDTVRLYVPKARRRRRGGGGDDGGGGDEGGGGAEA
jgi:uncharacterized membrane protein YgcG